MAKYRVLLMRDDQNVRRFGFNPKWFWLLVLTFIVVFAVATAGVYGVYVLYNQNEELKRQVEGLERELHAKNLELEHLNTVKKFFEANDPEELMALLGNIDTPEDPLPESPADIGDLTVEIDLNLLAVDNVSLKAQEDSTYRLSFDLSVVEENTSQAGQIHLELITDDGRVLDIDVPSDDMVFQIQRFKKIVTSFVFPDDAGPDETLGIRLTILDQAGEITLQRTYELESVLTQ